MKPQAVCYGYGIILLFLLAFKLGSAAPIRAAEKKALKDLRSLAGDVLAGDKYRRSDGYLIRFLLDANLNVTVANARLRKHMQYRKERKISKVIHEDFTDMRKWCNFEIQGKDFEGRPILYWPFGSCDLRRIALGGKGERLKRYLEHILESMAVAVRSSKNKDGEQVTQAIGILDLNGFSLRQQACFACLPFYRELIEMLDSNYPRGLESFNIINTPKSFHPVLEAVVTTAAPSTRQIVHVFGFNKEEWRKELLKKIPPNQLSAILGGTRGNYSKKDKTL